MLTFKWIYFLFFNTNGNIFLIKQYMSFFSFLLRDINLSLIILVLF